MILMLSTSDPKPLYDGSEWLAASSAAVQVASREVAKDSCDCGTYGRDLDRLMVVM